MHIPDGYLSPQSCAALGAAMVPVWYTASHKLRTSLRSRHVPLMAVAAAFAFVIQMFNIPIPDGTTAHAVGATLVAIVVGPWGAVVALTVALAIQALFFGDGGVLAFGANAFNLAFAAPLVGYYTYRLLSTGAEPNSSRRWIAAGIAGFVSINVAALSAAVQFGLQPILFRAADGTPLYSPYGLGQAIPAMMFAHVLFIGPVEAVVTALVVRYLQQSNPGLLEWWSQSRTAVGTAVVQPIRRRWSWAWVALGGLVVLSPLGLLASGVAWGEWAPEELEAIEGYAPEGLRTFSGLWGGVLPDYGIPGVEAGWLAALAYALSAAIGIAAVALVVVVIGRVAISRMSSKQ